MTCSTAAGLFIVALAGLAVGHVVGVVAWRRRLPEYSAWHWVRDPTYMYRSRYYQTPAPRLRFVAIGIHVVAVAALVALALSMMNAQRAGATSFCGFAF